MNGYSDVLFAQPSFFEGMARLLDFGNTLSEVNYSTSPKQADAAALAADWYAVGDDIRTVMETFAEENGLR